MTSTTLAGSSTPNVNSASRCVERDFKANHQMESYGKHSHFFGYVRNVSDLFNEPGVFPQGNYLNLSRQTPHSSSTTPQLNNLGSCTLFVDRNEAIPYSLRSSDIHNPVYFHFGAQGMRTFHRRLSSTAALKARQVDAKQQSERASACASMISNACIA